MGYLHLLCLFFLGYGCATVTCIVENSPALLWSPERSLVDFPDVSSVDSFSAANFYDQYLSPLMHRGQENAVVFLQDKLSVDDFTKYADVYSINSDGGAFKNVRRLMEDHFSLELPEVSSPLAAVEKIKETFDGAVHVVDKLSQLKSLQLEDGKRFLLIVNLQPVIGSGDEEKAITQNDAFVGDVTHHLQTLGLKYSALFTGKSGQQSNDAYAQSSDSTQHSNRHLLASAPAPLNETCRFDNLTGIMVFLCGFEICIPSGDDKCNFHLNVTLPEEGFASLSKKSNKTAEVVLKFDKLKNNKDASTYDVNVTMHIVLRQDRWVLQRQVLDLVPMSTEGNNTKIENGTLVNSELDKVVPRLYSFHCSRLKLYLETVKDKTYKDYKGTRVVLKGFQLQVFDTQRGSFYNAQDCVGFFTAGIWMGIVPGLLLLIILVYGTMMVLNLSVMDKFDNPKGKTITVNVVE